MKNIYKILLTSCIAIATAMSAFVGSARSNWDDQARRRKIDFIYMEAERQAALENADAQFELYRRAYEMDTTDTQIGSELAYFYLAMYLNSPDYTALGAEMLRRQFEADPSDLQTAAAYGSLLNQLQQFDKARHVWARLDSLYPERIEITMQYADALLRSADSADIVKAISKLEKLETVIGPEAQFTARKSASYIQLGDTAAAKRSVAKLLADAPMNADNYVFAGNFYSTLQQPDSAIYFYDKACAVDSTNGFAFYTRADYYRRQNDTAAFNRETAHALLNTDLDIEVKHDIMVNYVREYYADSLQMPLIDSLFVQVIDRNPHDYEFRTLYSSFLATNKRYHEGAEQADMALDIDPSDPAQWRSSVVLHLLAEDNDGAIAKAENALNYHPDNAEIYSVYGSALLSAERRDDAIGAMNRAFELTDSLDIETRSGLLGSIADTYHLLGQRDTAMIIYDRALEINPGNLMVMNNMAYFMAVDGRDLERAERLSAVTLREEPDNATWLDTYAWVLFKLRDYSKAKEYIDRALELDTEPSSEIFEHAGDIYFMAGDPAKAVGFWRKALETDPDNELLRRKVDHRTYFYE